MDNSENREPLTIPDRGYRDILNEYASKYISKCTGVDIPFPVMMEDDINYMHENVVKPITNKMLTTLFSDSPDINGRVWKKENCSKLLYDRYGNGYYIMAGSSRCIPGKTWLWLDMLMERLRYDRSLEISHIRCDNVMEKEIDINSVIHWNHSHPDYLKCIKVRYNMWKDLREFKCVMNPSPIQTTILESLGRFLPNMIDKGVLTTPNINVDDKKKLERVIKRRKKK